MDSKIIDECKTLSLAGEITFPEVVMKLHAGGVERYIADMVGYKNYYYGSDNSYYSNSLDFETQAVAADFSAMEVKAAITDIQQGKIDYRAFLKRIIDAGCSHYEVFITGRKVIYFGRDGSQHIELFPSR